MVRVTVELIPGGNEHHPRRRVLCTADISNTGEGTRTNGTYTYQLYGKNRRPMQHGRVEGYKRIDQHTWDLILMVLKHARERLGIVVEDFGSFTDLG